MAKSRLGRQAVGPTPAALWLWDIRQVAQHLCPLVSTLVKHR